MNAESRIANVEAQLKAVLRGDTNVINCPYCEAHNKQPKEGEPEPPLCCVTFAECVQAVMQRIETGNALDAAEVIAEHAVRSSSAN